MNYDNYRLNYNDCIGFLAYLALRERPPGQTIEESLEEMKQHIRETLERSCDYELQQAG